MLDENLRKLIELIEIRKNNAYKRVNEEMILLYLDIGKFLYELQQERKFGDKITTKAAEFMKNNYPNIKGFTKRNIERMIQFYKTYKDDEIATTLLTQINWSSNMLILSNTSTKEERHFYLKLTIKEKYSVRELNRQLQSSYYQRYMLSNGAALINTRKTIDENDYPNTRILDTYSLEFLDLPNDFSENDLKKSIIKNLKDFILEIGKGFTFVGDEYRVQVGNHDYFIDLLFYSRDLSCLVAIELKLGEFIPEYVGKMNLYLEVLDRNLRKENENPSVGIILCSSKDKEVVEYSLSKNISKTMISEYKLKLIDKKLLEHKLKDLKSIIENSDIKV